MKVTELRNKELEEACRQYRVRELYLFGSAASGTLSEDSDLDFLVVFNRTGYEGAFDQYMASKSGSRKSMGGL